MQTDECLSDSKLFIYPFVFLYEQKKTLRILSDDFKWVGRVSRRDHTYKMGWINCVQQPSPGETLRSGLDVMKNMRNKEIRG